MFTRMTEPKRDQRGITGLETAIIMIAFVVVAAVFAYTVLSAGIFSSDKGREAIHAGVKQGRSSMELLGPVVAKDTNDDENIDEIVFILANTLGGESINLTTTTDADADGVLSDETTRLHTMVISYLDQVQEVGDIAWTKTQLAKGDADNLLEVDEKFEITVNVSKLSTRLAKTDKFTIEVKPDQSSTIVIERRLPGVIDKVNGLN